MRVLNWRVITLCIVVSVVLSGAITSLTPLSQDKYTQSPVPSPSPYELLETAVKNSWEGGIHRSYSLLQTGVSSFRPIQGLDNPEVVPFLNDFVVNGPNLPGEKKLRLRSYVECCYATLCLGYIGDKRAFEPLVKVMQDEDYLADEFESSSDYDRRYPISGYTALALGYLGDTRAIEPLLIEMEKHKSERTSSLIITAIVMFRDIRTIKPIITYTSSLKFYLSGINEYLEQLTGVRFRFGSSIALKEDIKYIPELEKMDLTDVRKVVWQYWWKYRDEYAKQWFDQSYSIYKRRRENAPDEEARKKIGIGNMLRGGVAALPLLIETIEKGDESLIPVVAGKTKQYNLSDTNKGLPPLAQAETDKVKRLPPTATRAETLDWWVKNKDQWILKDNDEVLLPSLNLNRDSVLP